MNSFSFKPYLLIVWALVFTIASAAAMDRFHLFFLSVPGTLVVLILCSLWPDRWEIRNKRLTGGVLGLLSLAVIVSVLWTQWPLRVSYKLSKAGLNTAAARVKSGARVSLPTQIGLIRIRRVEAEGGTVCLWTDADYPTGFVQTSPDAPTPDMYHVMSMWHVIRLDGDWQFVMWED